MLRRSLRAVGSVGCGVGVAALASAAACGGDVIDEAPTVATVYLVVPAVVAVGERAQATAQAIGTNGLIISSSRVRVLFSSRDSTVARVDASSGVVTGVAPGRAAIVAESQGKQAMDTVQVVAR